MSRKFYRAVTSVWHIAVRGSDNIRGSPKGSLASNRTLCEGFFIESCITDLFLFCNVDTRPLAVLSQANRGADDSFCLSFYVKYVILSLLFFFSKNGRENILSSFFGCLSSKMISFSVAFTASCKSRRRELDVSTGRYIEPLWEWCDWIYDSFWFFRLDTLSIHSCREHFLYDLMATEILEGGKGSTGFYWLALRDWAGPWGTPHSSIPTAPQRSATNAEQRTVRFSFAVLFWRKKRLLTMNVEIEEQRNKRIITVQRMQICLTGNYDECAYKEFFWGEGGLFFLRRPQVRQEVVFSWISHCPNLAIRIVP